MAWEVLAIWLIVAVTMTWFVRDERRRRSEADLERAARYYAHASKYRHASAESMAPPPLRPVTGGLSREQRVFIEALGRRLAKSKA
jgi:hypothetical protein